MMKGKIKQLKTKRYVMMKTKIAIKQKQVLLFVALGIVSVSAIFYSLSFLNFLNFQNPAVVSNSLDIRRFAYKDSIWTIQQFADRSDSWTAHYDGVHGGSDNTQVHNLSPDYKSGLYRNIRGVYASETTELALFRTNGWLLKDSSGKEITSPTYGYYYVDLGNSAYQDWLAQWYKSYLQPRDFNFVYLDNGLSGSTRELWWDLTDVPMNPRTSPIRAWNHDEVINAQVQVYEKIRSVVGSSYPIIANGIYNGGRWFRDSGKMARLSLGVSHLDGYLSEGWLSYWSGSWIWYQEAYTPGSVRNNWKDSVDMIVDIGTKYPGKTVIIPMTSCDSCPWDSSKVAISENIREQYCKYMYYSLLLCASPQDTYYLGLGWWGEQYYQYLWTADYGEPMGTYYQVTGTHVYARDFTKSRIYVNPSETDYTIGGKLIKAHSGVILLIVRNEGTNIWQQIADWWYNSIETIKRMLGF